jgi:hypothetical protein
MGGYGPGEFGAVEPVLRLGEHHPGVDVSVALPVSHDPLSRLERRRRSGAEGLRAGGVAGVAVEQVGLDERDADVLGRRVGQQPPDPRPGAVRADQQARGDGGAVGEAHLVAALAEVTSGRSSRIFPFRSRTRIA